MQERGIAEAEVLSVLATPILSVEAQNGRFEARGWIERNGRQLLLRVIFEQGVVFTVITVIATSKFSKFGVLP